MSTPTMLPTVRKTEDMLKIESQHGGRDIRLILKDLYESTGSQRQVALRLGVKEATVSIWIARLGMSFTTKPIVKIAGVPSEM